MISLTHDGVAIELPDRLLWTDEYAWSPVVTETRWGTQGMLQVHTGTRQAGRPIALDGRESRAWITRTVCDQINAWAALEGATFTLLLRGATRTVMLIQFQAEPIWRRLLDGEHTPGLIYLPSLQFLEV